jgi:hypothetical protein
MENPDIRSSKPHVIFRCLCPPKESVQLRHPVAYCSFTLVAVRSTLKPQAQLLSNTHNSLYNIFTVNLPNLQRADASWSADKGPILDLYSEIALSRKPSAIGHLHMYTFLLRKTNFMTSQNVDISPLGHTL